MQIKRYIETHIVSKDTPHVTVGVCDDPGPGGANHKYVIECGDTLPYFIGFQNGPIAEVGQNGITNEALLAIVIDRLECFQEGPFACQENESALNYTIEALNELKKRTRERIERGVEGKNEA